MGIDDPHAGLSPVQQRRRGEGQPKPRAKGRSRRTPPQKRWATAFESHAHTGYQRILVIRWISGSVKMSFSSVLRVENSETTAPSSPA